MRNAFPVDSQLNFDDARSQPLFAVIRSWQQVSKYALDRNLFAVTAFTRSSFAENIVACAMFAYS